MHLGADILHNLQWTVTAGVHPIIFSWVPKQYNLVPRACQRQQICQKHF